MFSGPNKFVVLASLYAAQGLPFGFFTEAVPVVLRSQGTSLTWIGLSTLLAFPWALKWLWAPLVDRFYWPHVGQRRSWLLPLQGASLLSLLALGAVGEESGIRWLLIGCVVTNLLAATQDVATDGLAVRMLSRAERGIGNGLQVGGYRLGMVVGGGLLMIVFEAAGWSTTLWLMAATAALFSLPLLWLREPAAEVRERTATPRGLLSYVRAPGITLWFACLVAYKAGDAIASGMIRPMFVDHGLNPGEIGTIGGSVGSLCALGGAGLGGLLLRRLGQRRALLTFGLLNALSLSGYAWAALQPRSFAELTLLSGAEHWLGSMSTVALFAAMMGFCRAGSEGSDYTSQACVVVVITGLARALSGWLASALGYLPHFLLAAALCALGTALCWWAFARAEQRFRSVATERSNR